MTSDQIASMTSAFQQQSMQQMQYAAMISQNGGMGMPMSESMMGGMVNRGAAIGSPLMAAGMGLAGLDPIGMGIKGAMLGGRAFGMAGAVGGGLMGAGAVALPMMAAQYAGGQMMSGMQDQQMFNSQMRSAYTFSQPGQRGFASGDLNGMGQMMRQMSEMRGPGGETTSFDELSRMAASMGRMGMAKGVTDAREFSDKFKQMLTTVKEVAKAMSTSLEEAQQVMGGMKNAGVFKNQGAVANQIRGYALGGNIATSEITSMMGIGSQISRSIGGRGLAGAMGGMQTIGQIGLAQRYGTLSDEDIYNSTGLSGAEGRQAMATQMMQSSAQFLKGGLGRRFIASLAGENGKLDEGSISEYLYGGVGTGGTMAMAGRNLGKVGRANFIRNEGRLRGEALGRFGGLTNVIAMKGWLEQRGMDLSSGNDDRAMIFMQRRLGMGSDEAENALKMARDLPLLMRGQQNAVSDGDFNQSIDNARSHQGISGVKKKLEHAKMEINNYLKQAGAEYYAQGSNMIERWANVLTKTYYQDISADIGSAIRQAQSGGAMGGDALAQRFGMVGQGRGLVGQQYFGKMKGDTFGGGLRDALGGGMDSGGPSRQMQELNSAMGFSSMEQAKGMTTSYRTGRADGIGSRELSAYEQVGVSSKDSLRRMVAHGMLDGYGGSRVKNFSALMQKQGVAGLEGMDGLSGEQQAAIMGSVMRGAGLGGMNDPFMSAPGEGFSFSEGMFRTKSDRDSSVGEYMLGTRLNAQKDDESKSYWKERGSGSTWDQVKRRFNPLQTLRDIKQGYNDLFGDSIGGNKDMSQISEAAGSYLMSTKGQELSRNILSRDSKISDKARDEIYSRNAAMQRDAGKIETLQDLQDKVAGRTVNHMTNIERGEFEANRSMLMADEYMRAMESGGGQISDDMKQELVRKHGAASWEDFEKSAKAVGGSVAYKQGEDRKQLYKSVGASGAALKESFERSGLSVNGALTGGYKGDYDIGAKKGYQTGDVDRGVVEVGGKTIKISAGQRFLESMSQMAEAQSKLSEGSSLSEGENQMTLSRLYQGSMNKNLADMSVKEKRQLAQKLRETGGPDAATNMLLMTGGIQERLEKAGGGKGAKEKAIAAALGVNLDKDQMKALAGGNIDAATNIIGSSAFGSSMDSGTQDALKSAIEASRAGRTGDAANLLRDLQGRAADARKDRDEKEKDDADPAFRRLGEIKSELTGIKDSLNKNLTVTVTNIKDLKETKED